MEGEIKKSAGVWLVAIASSCYCYALSKVTRKGILRFVFVLPVNYLLATLPFSLSTYNLGGTTCFFLVWLSNFKLILFSFGLGPLPEAKSVSHFIFVLLLPIKIKHTESQSQDQNVGQTNTKETHIVNARGGRYALFGVKCLALTCVIQSYKYERPYYVRLGLYCFHIYLAIEMILAIGSALPRLSLGLELAPQVNEPYLATSLQDFWGRRWNLMVSDILRQTVHNPVRSVTSPLIGKKWSLVLGVFASFLFSALMHEVMLYYLTRASPTWEVTCFFILHGVCTVIEVLAKRQIPSKWWLPPAIAGPLTIGFVGVTAAWLFLPQFIRHKVPERGVQEYIVAYDYVKRNVLSWFNSADSTF